MLLLTSNPLLHPGRPIGPTVKGVEAEIDRLPHLATDRAHRTRRMRRNFRDVQKIKSAAAAVQRPPADDEAVHLAISGTFALWHLVPAAMELSGQSIDELTIATLGFSKANVAALCEMLDAGRVKTARLLASHYFKGTSAEIYAFAAEELGKRPGRASFLSVRTHAKLLLIKLADGRTLTVESSANLRSCKNIEQITLIGDPELYAFHRKWIVELFERADQGK